jgi:hypothetical protein
MIARDLEFELSIEPGWTARAEPADGAADEALQRLFAEIGPQSVVVQAGPTDGDVSGHSAGGTTVEVVVRLDDDDTEGHAFSLRFPSQDDAQRMRTRLAAGGLLIAVLAVGTVSVGAELSAPKSVTIPAAPAAPALPQAPDKPFISRGLTADIISGDIIEEEAPAPTPFLNRGLAADIRSGDIIQEESATAPAKAATPAKAPAPAAHGPKKE